MKKGIAAIVVIAALGIGGYALYSQGILGENSAAPKESTFQEFTDKDVVYTDEHIPYVDSQIVLTGTEDSDYAKIQKRVEKYDGQIVGYLPVTKDYQIQFDGKNDKELKKIVEDFSSWDQIEDAGLHEVFQVSEQTQDGQDSGSDENQQNNSPVWKSDPWNGASWSISNPDKEDENWWAEAIRMPEVWRMNHAIEYEPVKVGVFEMGYINSEHEELKNRFTDMSYNSKKQRNHGTQVCGILAAEQGNGKGFAGVAQNANLYGYSYDGKEETFASVMGFEFGITELLNKDVKVINMSIGASNTTGPAFYGGEENPARKKLERYNAKLRSFLKKYIDAGYDFLIIKAAGNESNTEWVKTDVSDEYPYGYKRTGNSLSESQNVDAKYDIFSGIEDTDGTSVKDHIIVVGSTRLNLNSDASATYNISTMSETGDRVDLYAPGDNIYTCKINDGEYSMDDSGTSFSAPMVTGAASLVWGIQPDLSAKQVRDIILEGATTEISGSNKHMLNVWESVYRAVMTEDNSKLQEQIKQYSVLGFVKDSDDKALEGATVTLYTKADDYSEPICTAQTDSEGVFDMVIARKSEWMTDPDWERIDGKLVISKDGYTQVEKEISLSTVEPVVYVDDIQMDNKLLKQLTDGYWQYLAAAEESVVKFKEDGTYYDISYSIADNGLYKTGEVNQQRGTFEIKGNDIILHEPDVEGNTESLTVHFSSVDKIENEEFKSYCEEFYYTGTVLSGDTLLTPLNALQKSELKNAPAEPEYYAAYHQNVEDALSEYGDEYAWYYLYDLNGDGKKELFVQIGTSEANYQMRVYTISNGKSKYLDTIGFTHSALVTEDGQLYRVRGLRGKVEEIYKITMNGNTVSEEMKESNDQYTDFGESLDGAMLNDDSLLRNS